ncbi:MAG: rhodanese-like domain-containing protein, partial [Parachlamydiaceae bacterium]
IKYRKQLVALDRVVDIKNNGEHISPEDFRKTLEGKDPYVLIDVRNNYETKVGSFKGAEIPPCSTYREFNDYARQLEERIDKKNTKVLMYCTGGIRCETFSSVLKEAGFEKVQQLEGGVINYGLKEGSKHWQGKLFVFDDRLTVPLSPEATEVIGKCHFCGCPTESYYNCANMDCNELFLACPACLKEYTGTCQTSCKSAKRLRPYEQQNPHKPFRKAYNYFK